jgi:hypothetical protein
LRLLFLADFRRLWFVGLVSSIVRWLEMLALALFAYQLTGSAFVVAMLTMLRMLPMGLFGAFIGAAAERLDRRRALVLVVSTSMASRSRWCPRGLGRTRSGTSPSRAS